MYVVHDFKKTLKTLCFYMPICLVSFKQLHGIPFFTSNKSDKDLSLFIKKYEVFSSAHAFKHYLFIKSDRRGFQPSHRRRKWKFCRRYDRVFLRTILTNLTKKI